MIHHRHVCILPHGPGVFCHRPEERSPRVIRSHSTQEQFQKLKLFVENNAYQVILQLELIGTLVEIKCFGMPAFLWPPWTTSLLCKQRLDSDNDYGDDDGDDDGDKDGAEDGDHHDNNPDTV